MLRPYKDILALPCSPAKQSTCVSGAAKVHDFAHMVLSLSPLSRQDRSHVEEEFIVVGTIPSYVVGATVPHDETPKRKYDSEFRQT